MKKIFAYPVIAVLCFFLGQPMAKSQFVISSQSTPHDIDFTGFTGSGLDPNPGSGQLDSDTWSVKGLSDGDVLFGGTGTSGDFARGTSTGGEITGGIYSFDNGTTGEMLGFQATGGDMTPGSMTLRVENNTGDTITNLEVSYTVWMYNDQNRANNIQLAYSMDNSTFTPDNTVDVVSPEVAAGAPSWKDTSVATTITGLTLEAGDTMYLKWNTDDVSGSGSRDELGIDNITLTGSEGAASVDAGFDASPTSGCEPLFVGFTDTSEVSNDTIISWEWDFDDGDTSMTQDPTHEFNAGTFDVKLVVTTGSGLVDSSSMTITVDTTDDPSFNYDTTSYCSQDSDPTPTITGDAGGTFSEGTGNLSINASTGTIDLSASTPGSYTVFYETSGTCPNSATFPIEVVDQYDATISDPGALCDQDTVIDLQATDDGGTWSGPGIVDANTGGFNPSIAGTGTHQIVHEIGGPCGDDDTLDITVQSSLDATIDPAGPFCVPSVTVQLTANDGGGTWSGPGILNSSTGEFSPNDAGVGNHIIQYEITGTCGDMDTILIEVDSSADASIDPAGPFCETDPNTFLTAADTGGTWSGNGIIDTVNGEFSPQVAGPGSHSIIYSIDGQCGNTRSTTIEIFDSVDTRIHDAGPYCILGVKDTLTAVDTGGFWAGPGIIDTAQGIFHPDTAGAGLHPVVHYYGSQDTCSVPDTMMIRVFGIPDATIDTTLNGPFCNNDPALNLTAADTGGVWSGAGITDSVAGTFNPNMVGTGIHEVYYSIDRIGGCDAKDTMDITVIDAPVADFSYTNNGLTVDFTEQSTGESHYYWEFGDGNTSSDTMPTHTYAQDTVYIACLTVWNDQCSDTICDTVDLRGVGIKDRSMISGKMRVFPNPTERTLNIEAWSYPNFNEGVVRLKDLMGRTVKERSIRSSTLQRMSMDVNGLAEGTYIVEIRTDKFLMKKKVVIE